LVPFQVTGLVLRAGGVLPTWEEAIAAPELPACEADYLIDFIELMACYPSLVGKICLAV
jgi:hypothetical protein